MEHLQERKKSTTSTNGQRRGSFFAPVAVQAKLTVNTPGDQFEQEADSVAEKVVSRLSQTSPIPDLANTPSSTQNNPTAQSAKEASNRVNINKPQLQYSSLYKPNVWS